MLWGGEFNAAQLTTREKAGLQPASRHVLIGGCAANAVSRAFDLNDRSAPCCGRSELRDIDRLLAEGEVVDRLTATEAVFHIPGSRDVKLLLEDFRDSMKTITDSGLKLLPRN